MILSPTSPTATNKSDRTCGCGQVNCIETFSSAKSTASRYQELVAQSSSSAGDSSLGSKDVFLLAAGGDAIAQDVIEKVQPISQPEILLE